MTAMYRNLETQQKQILELVNNTITDRSRQLKRKNEQLRQKIEQLEQK